jgi:hypothetical protein
VQKSEPKSTPLFISAHQTKHLDHQLSDALERLASSIEAADIRRSPKYTDKGVVNPKIAEKDW